MLIGPNLFVAGEISAAVEGGRGVVSVVDGVSPGTVAAGAGPRTHPSSKMKYLLPVVVLWTFCRAASPDEPHGVIGVRKLATAVDCSGAVAFSAAGGSATPSGQVGYQHALNDRGVGWSRDTGEFTCHCPGLYHFAFAGYGEKPNTRLMLKRRVANTTEWIDVVSAGGPASGGGSNIALLDLEVGDHTAVWLSEGSLLGDATSSSFSGYRIIKK